MDTNLKKKFSLSDKTVLITGASGFFGGYMATTFLEAGATCVLVGRSDKLKTQADQYRKSFGEKKVKDFQVDFYNREAFKKTLEEIASVVAVDVVINNAYDLSPKTGFNTDTGTLEESTFDQWQAAFESGVYWAALTTQIIGKQFKKRGGGSIINISSMYGIVAPDPALYEGRPFLNPPTYGVMKAGILALTRYTASFWAKHNIRCNAISPGPFSNTETESANSVEKNDPFLEKLKDKTLLRRVGHPNDLRGALLFLASDASSYMTGANIVIDGGWTVI